MNYIRFPWFQAVVDHWKGLLQSYHSLVWLRALGIICFNYVSAGIPAIYIRSINNPKMRLFPEFGFKFYI
jgi:hypothetical protein